MTSSPCFLAAVAFGCLTLADQSPPSLPPPVKGLAPEVEAELRKGRADIRFHQFPEALRSLKRANKLAGGRCFECLEAIASVYVRMNEYGDAIEAGRSALNAAGSDAERARAHYQVGMGHLGRARKGSKKGKDLLDAEEAFRKALELDEALNAARYQLSRTLIRASRDQDADALLDEYLARQPSGDQADLARALKENHRRATEPFVPFFRATTLDGQTITPESLRGKVVLIDFWATWCSPCVAALPDLKRLKKVFAGQPFEILGISVDRDRAALQSFVNRNAMTWPQVFDEGFRLAPEVFGVNTFPSYFVVDAEGMILYSADGWSTRTSSRLHSEIREALTKTRSVAPGQ